MIRKHLWLTLALLLVLAACGEPADSGDTDDAAPVIQIRTEGGFAPIEFILGNGPNYTLLSDGTLIFRGPQPEIFPGPLVPDYQVVRLSDESVDRVMEFVDEIGLAGMVDEFDNSAAAFVADASTEVITLWDENGAHRYSVYALGIGDDPLNPSEPADPRTVALADLIDFVASVDIASAETFQADRVRVVGGATQFPADPEFVDVRDWPLGEEDPASWNRVNQDWTCQQFGPEVLDAFTDATTATTWDLGGTEFKLLVRPLLPGEPSCPV